MSSGAGTRLSGGDPGCGFTAQQFIRLTGDPGSPPSVPAMPMVGLVGLALLLTVIVWRRRMPARR